jgi:putative transposase
MIRAIVKKKVCLSQSKPILEQLTATLNSNCISFIDSNNSFDLWLKIDSLGIFGRNKPIYIPIKGHRHINSLLQQDFNLAKDITLRVNNLGKLECLLFLKKDIITKVNGSTLGIDLGVKKLLSTSKNQFLGTKIETLIKKINNKQTNSKAYKRAIIETKEYVNKTIKQLDLTSVKSIVIEDLRKIKHTNSRKQKLTKSFKRIIHHWPCGQTINKLKEICELLGVQVITVNLYNTSITCSNCGNVNKKDRQGEVFKCSLCNSVVDSDFNASLNILLRGLSQPNMVGCKSL